MKLRAEILERIRHYFAESNVLEVTTPVLSFAGNTDPFIDSFKTSSTTPQYLHTSPEFFMKRLLTKGCGSIYQVCNVFREGEAGRFHNPEFSMLEWYRLDYDYQQLMDDVAALIRNVSDKSPEVVKISYQDAFKSLGINPHVATESQLADLTERQGISLQGMGKMSRDDWLNLLMSHVTEPGFDKEKLTFVFDYPVSQASLAKVRKDKYPLAERFELYWGGIELANGFTELLDADEQRWRFNHDNQRRLKAGLEEVPVDEKFLDALARGLPACSGVALGLDRLLMVICGATSIDQVMSFPQSEV
ncbi:MAG: EF-P lysine aminoacylase GenX [Gammaproteobacteria bacterium]|nr:EF-P lysine aminoacylase GenX [Gammaproteobacteria bacterium]